MHRLSDALERLGYFAAVRDDLAVLRREMNLLAADAPYATLVRWWLEAAASRDAYNPVPLMPILQGAGISQGVAVGWHTSSPSVRQGIDGHHYDGRLPAGCLVYSAKLYDSPKWDTDLLDIHRIGALATCALAAARLPAEPDLIIAIPSSRGTNSLPRMIARDVGFLARIQVAPAETARFTRSIAQVKEMRDYWEKCAVLDGAMEVEPRTVAGRHVVVIDDVCRSGATLRECGHACCRAGAASVTALAVSKTWRFQRIPDIAARTLIEPDDAL